MRPPRPWPSWRRAMSRSIASRSRRRPAGSPSTTQVRPGPWDSPAVMTRNTGRKGSGRPVRPGTTTGPASAGPVIAGRAAVRLEADGARDAGELRLERVRRDAAQQAGLRLVVVDGGLAVPAAEVDLGRAGGADRRRDLLDDR